MRVLNLQPKRFATCMLAMMVSVGVSQMPNLGAALTDAQAQSLMMRMQAQPGIPLTEAESTLLAQYFLAKNAQMATALAQHALPAQTGAKLLHAGATAKPTPAAVTVNDGPAAASPVAAGAKKPGVVRIGVALTKADFGQGSATGSGESVRSLIGQYLAGPKIEVATLVALLPQQAEAEAKERECDYIIYSTITQKKSSSGGGMGFLKSASPMLSMIPMVGLASGAAGAMAAAGVASAAASGAASMANMSGQVKARNDVTFEYQLLAPGSATPVLTNKSTAHAKTDGEDVITPLIEAAATSIVSKVNPK